MEFKVIEFNKASKRIILSHSRIFEDAKKGEEVTEKKSKGTTTQKAVKKLKDNLEKTTLGDISELAALKTELEENQKKKKKKDANEGKE
jgi:small subunit ribosomal protein S1